MMKTTWIICQLVLFVSLGHARHTKNLKLVKDEIDVEPPKYNFPVTPESCVGDNVEWLITGPVCEVYCDHQPPTPSVVPHRPCQARMYDVIHDIINDAEEDPLKVFKDGVIDLDRIAVNVTNNMRKWGSARLHTQDQDSGPGCYCKSGFAWLGNVCVPIKECPPRETVLQSDCKAENHEIWKDDGPGCDVFCPAVPRRKWRTIYSARNLVRCEGDMLRTLQEFEPTVTDLASEITKEVMSKFGDIVTQKLRSGHAAVKRDGAHVAGCYCMDGYMRFGDVCVKPDKCPTKDSPISSAEICPMPHEEFHKVSDHCEVYCEIQPAKYGRGSSTSINSCGRTGDFVRSFLPTVEEYKNAFDQPTVVAKYAENITETIRSANKQTFSDGCYCKPGYARYGYRCIRLDQCPMRRCHKWEVFQVEGPVCEATCANLRYHHSILVQGPDHSMPGCFCPAGQVRDDRGRCVDPVICWNYHVKPSVESDVPEDEPAVPPVVQTIPDPEAIRKETVKIKEVQVVPKVEVPVAVPSKPVEEKPIFNRKILENVPLKEKETPVVDGFKKEHVPEPEVVPVHPVVPVAPVVNTVVPVQKNSEEAVVHVPVVNQSKEKVVVVEEMSVPVVAIYDRPF